MQQPDGQREPARYSELYSAALNGLAAVAAAVALADGGEAQDSFQAAGTESQKGRRKRQRENVSVVTGVIKFFSIFMHVCKCTRFCAVPSFSLNGYLVFYSHTLTVNETYALKNQVGFDVVDDKLHGLFAERAAARHVSPLCDAAKAERVEARLGQRSVNHGHGQTDGALVLFLLWKKKIEK